MQQTNQALLLSCIYIVKQATGCMDHVSSWAVPEQHGACLGAKLIRHYPLTIMVNPKPIVRAGSKRVTNARMLCFLGMLVFFKIISFCLLSPSSAVGQWPHSACCKMQGCWNLSRKYPRTGVSVFQQACSVSRSVWPSAPRSYL